MTNSDKPDKPTNNESRAAEHEQQYSSTHTHEYEETDRIDLIDTDNCNAEIVVAKCRHGDCDVSTISFGFDGRIQTVSELEIAACQAYKGLYQHPTDLRPRVFTPIIDDELRKQRSSPESDICRAGDLGAKDGKRGKLEKANYQVLERVGLLERCTLPD